MRGLLEQRKRRGVSLREVGVIRVVRGEVLYDVRGFVGPAIAQDLSP